MTDTNEQLARVFEENRRHLGSLAFRMLGSASEAEDAVQEGWIRLSRVDTSTVGNISGWLTTVVARVCLDMLRSRKARREDELDASGAEGAAVTEPSDLEHDVQLADSVGLAMLVVLESLSPAERVAFVLHDMFDLPFEEIAPVIGRSLPATRQLASRARRRVQGTPSVANADRVRHRQVVDAFLKASRGGDFSALLELLDPSVVLRADAAAVAMGAAAEVRGANAVAETFAGRARVARVALVDGAVGLVWAPGGEPRVVFALTIDEGRIAAIDLIADATIVGGMKLEMLE